MCNTLGKLFSQALVRDVICREDRDMVGLLVEVVGGGNDSVEAFKIAQSDTEEFENLQVALARVVKDWCLKGTYVEVGQI